MLRKYRWYFTLLFFGKNSIFVWSVWVPLCLFLRSVYRHKIFFLCLIRTHRIKKQLVDCERHMCGEHSKMHILTLTPHCLINPLSRRSSCESQESLAPWTSGMGLEWTGPPEDDWSCSPASGAPNQPCCPQGSWETRPGPSLGGSVFGTCRSPQS